jgi:hypothetical protein
MRCEFGVFENGQRDNAGENNMPSDADVAEAQEASHLEFADGDLDHC